MRVALLGDSGVGKTSLLRRLMTHSFQPRYVATSVAQTSTVGSIVLVDTCGQDKYGMTLPPNLDVVVLLFDITNKQSYKNLTHWFATVPPGVRVIVLGTKCDIEPRRMMASDIEFHRTHRLAYFEVSCKTGYGVDRFLECVNG